MSELGQDKRARMRRLVRRLHGDEQGNVIVLYIAAALLLVGMLWAIIGTGARMVQKETIQSSADAAAFSAAVIKAKGLNIIAFCNLVMALLLAIIMLLRLVKGVLLIVLGVCLAACFDIFGGEVLCGLAPEVQTLYDTYSNLESQVEPRLIDVMKGLSKLERAVSQSFPALALVEAYHVGTNDQYKRNFGKGTLVTVAWPLPVGGDLSLPTKDGTWDKLCSEATESIGDLVQLALIKMKLGAVAGIFGDGVQLLLTPLQGVLCGSGGGSSTTPVDTTETKTTCGECANATKSTWSGSQVVLNPDGSIKSSTPGTCLMDGFSALACSGSSATFTCADGNDYKITGLQSCLVKVTKQVDLGGATSDKPLPLELADDWKQHKDVRAFTLLTDANVAARRQSVNVASKNKGSSPALNQLLGTAQAEFFAFNGNEDLWHMNWRARLVRFTFGDTSTTDTGSAGGSGVSGAAAGQISGALQSFLSSDTAALADQFMLH